MTTPDWLVAWAGDEQSCVLEVTASGAAAQAVAAHVPDLVEAGVAGGIARQDGTLWGPAASDEAAVRLAWVDLAETSRGLIDQVLELREDLRAEGVDRVVLCGMGGSSLAPEVITRTAGVPLVVLDGTDPDQVRSALAGPLRRTVVVVSSKSGSTVETDSHRRAFEAAFDAAGIDARTRMVVVTDPGSPLETTAREAGYRTVFRADPHVGGRFSALSAFGLVPAGLAGADIGALLDDAAAVADLLTEDSDGNPALVLGSAIAGSEPLRDKLVLVDEGSGLVGFGDWAEQLLAESTGKQGTGLLPVVVDSPTAPEVVQPADDVLVVRWVPELDEADDHLADFTLAPADPDASAEAGEGDRHTVTVAGPLGGQMIMWEYAVAVAGRILGVNPFDQPDVDSAKQATRRLLESPPPPSAPDLVDGPVQIRATAGLLGDAGDLAASLEALLRRVGPRGYTAVAAYLDRQRDAAALSGLRDAIAARTRRPATFGWGPRLLHSTGQFHKGGPRVGVHLQITAAPDTDLEIPGRPFTFGQLISAQAAGDAQVLAAHDQPLLRLHLTDRAEGLRRLQAALGSMEGTQ